MRFIKTILLLLFSVTFAKAQVSVYGKVDHIEPDGIDTVGGIALTVSGSTAPYTYTWNPGAINTQDISNQTAGQYTLNVRSASSQTYTNKYTIGYKVKWTALERCKFSNDSLISTTGGGLLYSKAVSKNTLSSGTNGWFEYVVSSVAGISFIGFCDSVSPIINNPKDIDFGIYRYSNLQINAYEGGTTYVLTSSPKVGDVLRVERNGNVISYKLNGNSVRTTTVSGVSSKNFRLKAAMNGTEKILNAGCSFMPAGNMYFPNFAIGNPYITHVTTSGSNDGYINFSPGITGSFTYSWSTGATTNSVSGLSTGQYKLNIENSDTISFSKYYAIGYKAQWSSLNLCRFRNDSITSLTNSATIYSKAVTKNTLTSGTDGWFEFVIGSVSTKNAYIGFLDSISPLSSIYTDIDYGFVMGDDGMLSYYEGGTVTDYTSQRVGDIVRIERTGNTIYYKVNGVTIKSTTVSGLSSKTLKVKAAMAYPFSIANIGCSFITSGGVFPNYVAVTPYIKHSSGLGINDGLIKITPKVSFANTYSWTPGGATTNSITSLGYGADNVTVKDSLLNTSSYYYKVGYKVQWTNLDYCNVYGDSLVSYITSNYFASASSKNTLRAGENGWMEFPIEKITGETYNIGFLDSISPVMGAYGDIDYGINFNSVNNALYYYENGAIAVLYSNPSPGDLIKVERVSNTIYYKVNNVTLRSLTVSGLSSKVFKIKANIQNADYLARVGCSFYDTDSTSFKNYIGVNRTIKHSSGQGIADGSVSIAPKIAGTYTYSWTPGGATASSITGISAGTYTSVIKDSEQNTSPNDCNVGYKAKWTNLSQCFFRNDTLKGTGPNNTYTGNAYSKNILQSGKNGWVEYIIKSYPANATYFGFTDSSSTSVTTLTELSYGINIPAFSRAIYYYEGGSSNLLFSYLRPGDVLRLERSGNNIYYKINGAIIRTVTSGTIGTKVLKLKARLQYNNELVNVGCSFGINNNTITGSVTNVVNDTTAGQVSLAFNNGLPYNIAWNGRKLQTATKTFNDVKMLYPTAIFDSVIFKKNVDSLRLQRSLVITEPGFYKATVYNYSADSLNVIAFAGTEIDWLVSTGITHSTTAIPSRKIKNTNYFYGNGKDLTQNGAFHIGQSVAVASNPITRSYNHYIQFSIPNSLDTLVAGLEIRKAAIDTLVPDSTMRARFKFQGNSQYKVRFCGTDIFSGTYHSGDLFAIATDTTTKKVLFYKNDTLVANGDLILLYRLVDSTIYNGFTFKVLMGNANARLSNLIMKTPFIRNRITAAITDVSCGNSCSGLIDAYGLTLPTSIPVKYELYDEYSNLLNTVNYSSGTNHALFTGICGGKYTVKYYGTVYPPYLIGSHPPASYPVVLTQQFDVGYVAEWQSKVNVNVISPFNSLEKAPPGLDYTDDAGASTQNSLSNSSTTQWMEYKASGNYFNFSFGLSNTDNDLLPTSINYRFDHICYGGGLFIYDVYENNNYQQLNSGYFFGFTNANSVYRIEKNNNTITFRVDGFVVKQISPALNYTLKFLADASISTLDGRIVRPRMSFGCPFVEQYTFLKKKLDGGYYITHNRKLLFKYDEEYADTDGKLTFNIYDKNNNIVMNNASVPSLSAILSHYGDNRCQIDLANPAFLVSGQTMPSNNFYILEVINEKNEKWYLRFKI